MQSEALQEPQAPGDTNVDPKALAVPVGNAEKIVPWDKYECLPDCLLSCAVETESQYQLKQVFHSLW